MVQHLSDVNETANRVTSWWWVNQNKTYRQEREGGYIWAPQKTKSGGEAFHHANVSKVKKGDVVWHYCNQKVVAVSVAETDAFEQPKPEELETDDWETDGYMVKVKYFDLVKPIDRNSIPFDLRAALSKEKKSPFNRGGTVNQGYLFALTEPFVAELTTRFPDLLPDGVNAPSLPSGSFSRHDDASVFAELRDKLRNLNVNRDYGSIKLYKPGIVLAALENIDRSIGDSAKNEIRFDEIVPTFQSIMERYDIKSGIAQAQEAFFRLDRDGIWDLVPVQEEDLTGLDPATLRRLVSHAQFQQRYWRVVNDKHFREELRKDLINTWFDQSHRSASVDQKPFDRAGSLQKLIDDIASAGYIFEPWQIAAYVTAVRTKPFVILAGVSGSGKSQLPQIVAKITGGESEVIPVRPDWTDSSDVLGFVQLQGRMKPGKFLKVVDIAAQDPNVAWFAVIDEMNIARVEHYFAEVLSKIEQTRSNHDEVFPLFEQQLEHPDDTKWNRLALPPNLAIIGTVNMDESTHGFSKKVLDRAFTLEFSQIKLEQWQNIATSKEFTSQAWPVDAWRPRAESLAKLADLKQPDIELINATVQELVRLNEILAQAQLQLAYRSRDEIVLFVLHAKEVSDSFVTETGGAVNPLDLAIQMKVLPRITGSSSTVKTLLQELLGFAIDGDRSMSDEAAASLLTDWLTARKPSFIDAARLPRTAARLCLMLHRLQQEGYTSNWL
jgi:hypothetical protein